MSETRNTTPLITLWYKPGQTLQGLIAGGRGHRGALVVAALFGLVMAWPRFVAGSGGNPVILVAAVMAGVGGLYFFSWLLRNFGRWFGGGAALADVRTALGWGLLPWVMSFGGIVVFASLREFTLQQVYPVFFVGLVYGFVTLLSALSAGLRLNFIKTFLCLVVTLLVSLFPLTLILQLTVGPPPVSP